MFLLELVSTALGFVIVFITYRAGKLTTKRYLLLLSLGFGIISTGSLIEELISISYELSIRQNHLIESIFVNIGLFIIWLALKEEKYDQIVDEVNDSDYYDTLIEMEDAK